MTEAYLYYTKVATEQQARADRLRRRYNRLSVVRLLLFVLFIALLIVGWSTDWRWGLAVTLLPLPLIVRGVRWHAAIGRQAARAQTKGELAEAELRALDHDFSDWPDGSEFVDSQHPYTGDLDIFGQHSLFQFINRTVTVIGHIRLADHLRELAAPDVAADRRKGSKILATQPEWCLDFRTIGHELADDPTYRKRLIEWIARPRVVTGRFTLLMLWLAPVLTAVGLWLSFSLQPWQLGLLFFVPAVLLLRKYTKIAAREHALTARMGELLSGYAELLEFMEKTNALRAGGDAGQAAPKAFRQLSYYISQLDVRYNPFAALLEISGLWSLQWLYRLDRWRTVHKDHLEGWLEKLASTDAGVSWATLRFNQRNWTEPIHSPEAHLGGRDIGHPLLSPAGRVTNDIDIGTDGHIHLVTGSNMAGKSTWLRTVGVNLVLAQAGGPVCAHFFQHPSLTVWTSMRTQDDLSESTSSFYAELKRLKQIIEAVSDPDTKVFFLLDEILKGTNSRDRHTGARALIRQLIRERGAGIIATHDLELAALADEAGSRVENYAMEVQTREGKLTFDYQLRRGVSQSFNATALMASMGIDIDPADIKLTHD